MPAEPPSPPPTGVGPSSVRRAVRPLRQGQRREADQARRRGGLTARGLRPQPFGGDGEPPVELPDLGPDPLDEHGAPRAASVPFMLTQDMKRRLRAYGYSDEEIAHLTPQQAHEILAREGRQPDA